MSFCVIRILSIADERETDLAIMSIRFFSVLKYLLVSVSLAISIKVVFYLVGR